MNGCMKCQQDLYNIGPDSLAHSLACLATARRLLSPSPQQAAAIENRLHRTSRVIPVHTLAELKQNVSELVVRVEISYPSRYTLTQLNLPKVDSTRIELNIYAIRILLA